MASRPKRMCTERARERIARILEWENCTESSKMFRAAAAEMDREFGMSDGGSDYATANEEQSSDDAMDEDMDETESSEHSPPSSAADAHDPPSDLCFDEPEKNTTHPTDEPGGPGCSMHAAV